MSLNIHRMNIIVKGKAISQAECLVYRYVFSWLENPRSNGEYCKEGIPIDT